MSESGGKKPVALEIDGDEIGGEAAGKRLGQA
jgi:hypothetical protein